MNSQPAKIRITSPFLADGLYKAGDVLDVARESLDGVLVQFDSGHDYGDGPGLKYIARIEYVVIE